eukprot:2642673-Rhodomonas_salina.3
MLVSVEGRAEQRVGLALGAGAALRSLLLRPSSCLAFLSTHCGSTQNLTLPSPAKPSLPLAHHLNYIPFHTQPLAHTTSSHTLDATGQWVATFKRVVLPLESQSEKLVRATWETVKATRSPAEIADSMYYNLVSAPEHL